MHPFGIEHALQQHQHIFRFGVGQIERPNHQILILLLLLLGIGADNHDARGYSLGEQAIAVENEIEGLFERRVLNANGHRVISDILVENEVDPSGLSNPFQDFFKPGIAKPKCHRLLPPIITVQRLLLLGEFGDTVEGFLERGIQLSRSGISLHGLVGPTELGEAVCLSILAARIFQAKRFKQSRLMIETGWFNG